MKGQWMGTHSRHRRWSAHAPGTLAAVVVISVITSFAAVGATTVSTGTTQSSGKSATSHKAAAHRCFGLFPGRGTSDHYIEYPAGCSGGSNGSCTFPWYSYRASAAALEFGGAYPNVTNSYNTYNQFRRTPTCSGPFGPNTIFCPTTLSPKPPIP